MRQTGAVPVLETRRSERLRAYRGADTPHRRIDQAEGYVPFAGVGLLGGERGRSWERAEIEEMLSALERFVERPASSAGPGTRVLATVLFTDIVASTERAAALGDKAWSETLNRHDEIARSVVRRCAGRLIKSTGD